MNLHGIMMCFNEAKFLPQAVNTLVKTCDTVTVMDNGSSDGSIEYLETVPGITLVLNEQESPPHYANMLNKLLSAVPSGGMVLRLDPDETLTEKAISDLRNLDMYSYGIPIFHLMKSTRECMPIEFAYSCMRLWPNKPGLSYRGRIHEQVNYPAPWAHIDHEATGIAMIHYSYLDEARLRRKSVYYSEIAGSGFDNPTELSARLDLNTKPLPEHIIYDETFARRLVHENQRLQQTS